MGVQMVIYLDDLILINHDRTLLLTQTKSTVWLLERLGFVINWEKSVIYPVQEIEFLGFKLNAPDMLVSLPEAKITKIQMACAEMVQNQQTTIRQLAALVGKMNAALKAILPGQLRIRRLQMCQTEALLRNEQSYSASITLPPDCIREIKWWLEEIKHWNGRTWIAPNPDMIVTTDASKIGWGATCAGQTTQGKWTAVEKEAHINVLELKAVLFAIKAFTKECQPRHIHVRLDNVAAVANINKMGGTKSKALLDVTETLWQFCMTREIMITAEHLPGRTNTVADHQSRVFKDTSSWQLDPMIFMGISKLWGPFQIDLFAGRVNAQLPRFVSWKPDPEAEATDAFAIPWTGMLTYMFPPFCLISRCLAKVHKEKTTAVIVTPSWQCQPWYGRLLQMTVDYPCLLPKHAKLLVDQEGKAHLSFRGATKPIYPVSDPVGTFY
jgi:hypothetical protein